MSDPSIDYEHFRDKLLALRAELEAAESVGNTDADTVELDQQRQGRLSRMDALNAQAMTQATQGRRRQALRRVDVALARIESGNYGYCDECEEPIGIPRLEFDPSVLLCIACASRAESK